MKTRYVIGFLLIIAVFLQPYAWAGKNIGLYSRFKNCIEGSEDPSDCTVRIHNKNDLSEIPRIDRWVKTHLKMDLIAQKFIKNPKRKVLKRIFALYLVAHGRTECNDILEEFNTVIHTYTHPDLRKNRDDTLYLISTQTPGQLFAISKNPNCPLFYWPYPVFKNVALQMAFDHQPRIKRGELLFGEPLPENEKGMPYVKATAHNIPAWLMFGKGMNYALKKDFKDAFPQWWASFDFEGKYRHESVDYPDLDISRRLSIYPEDTFMKYYNNNKSLTLDHLSYTFEPFYIYEADFPELEGESYKTKGLILYKPQEHIIPYLIYGKDKFLGYE